jgi:hypothetical protein
VVFDGVFVGVLVVVLVGVGVGVLVGVCDGIQSLSVLQIPPCPNKTEFTSQVPFSCIELF